MRPSLSRVDFALWRDQDRIPQRGASSSQNWDQLEQTGDPNALEMCVKLETPRGLGSFLGFKQEHLTIKMKEKKNNILEP